MPRYYHFLRRQVNVLNGIVTYHLSTDLFDPAITEDRIIIVHAAIVDDDAYKVGFTFLGQQLQGWLRHTDSKRATIKCIPSGFLSGKHVAEQTLDIGAKRTIF